MVLLACQQRCRLVQAVASSPRHPDSFKKAIGLDIHFRHTESHLMSHAAADVSAEQPSYAATVSHKDVTVPAPVRADQKIMPP